MTSEVLGTCDRGKREFVPAAVRVRLLGGGSLEFCLHHWNELELVMLSAGAVITVDHRDALYTKA